tara:strand:- start:13365 stop:13727 length:363 start_codon:yes stop_codon:yes gene_type:complete
MDFEEYDQQGIVFAVIVIGLIATASVPYKPSFLFLSNDCYWAEGEVTGKEYDTQLTKTDYFILFNGTFDNETDFDGRVYVPLYLYLQIPIGYKIEGEEFCDRQTLREWIQSGNLTINFKE